MSQAGAAVSQRPPPASSTHSTHTTHTKHPSISSITPSITSAPPPTKAEVERKLSVKLTGVNVPRRPTRSKSQHVGSGNESDTSSASTSLPPLITSSLVFGGGGHFTTSPVGTPSTPHGPLTAIAERHGPSTSPSSRMTDALPNQQPLPADETAAAVDEDDSDEENGAELERGMDGERIFKSGFLIKKQERRKLWKKKWFVLRATKLAYYKDNREYSLSRAIDLHQVHSVVPVTSEKQKHPFAFAIVTSDRNFMVEALSAEERDDWVRAINSVRKRMSEREEEEARRQQQQAQSQSRPVAVPAPQAPHPGDHHLDTDTHHGTWTSTFSSTTGGLSVSPAASTSGGYFRPSNPGPSSWQPPRQDLQGNHPQSPSGITSQMANANLGRSPSASKAPPSAASVNRRLSNPIPVPTLQPKAGQLRPNQSFEQQQQSASLSPPQHTPQFVSSDEDEPYFSDPNAAWPEGAPAQQQEGCFQHPPDPNQIILAMYLMKKSRKTTRQVWRKRWFYLTAAGITYTKSHMDSRPLTFIPISTILDVFSVDEDDDDEEEGSSGPDARSRSPPARHTSMRTKKEPPPAPKNHEHVVRIVCAKRRYDLCAPSEEEEIKWTAAIRALINRERERQAGRGGGDGGKQAAERQSQASHAQSQNQAQTQSQAQAPPQQAPAGQGNHTSGAPAIAQKVPAPQVVTNNLPSPNSMSTSDSPTSATARRAAAR